MAEDLYATLGVPRSADAEAIKKAYRKLAKDLHPDRHPGDKQAEARFKSVNRAYDVLSDPKKRKLYDEFGEAGLREGFDPDQARAYRAWSSRQQGPRAQTGGIPFDIEDLFGGHAQGGFADVFGDMFGRRRGPARGHDLETETTIDFASALRGAMLELQPRGAGSPVTVRIPPGAADGQRVRIPGQGLPSSNGGPPGDLILVLHVTPHPYFRREGDDLHLDLPITVSEAYRGAKVKVPTIDGQVSLKVPEGAQSGTVVRLRGKGVARKGKPPGDLYVHFLIKVPTSHAPELARAIDQIAKFEDADVRRDVKL
jgi:curved DNA-binding protein